MTRYTVCAEPGCPELVEQGSNGRCPAHGGGPWAGSTRRQRLPSDWHDKIRPRIMRRDGPRCQWINDDGTLCGARATDVDHIDRGDDHRDSNLRALCGPHHASKSGREGNAARYGRSTNASTAAPAPPPLRPRRRGVASPRFGDDGGSAA